MRRILNFENIIGLALFIFSFVLSTINFSALQRINTNFYRTEDLNTLRGTIFELVNIMQITLISTLLLIVALIFIIFGLIRN